MSEEFQQPEIDLVKIVSSVLPIALMMFYNKLGLDNEDPKVLWGLRAFYGISQLIYFGLLFFMEYRIRQTSNLPEFSRVITYVEKVPPAEQQANPELGKFRYATKTVYEYDLEQIAVLRSYMPVAITVGLHCYFGFVQPLFIQSFTNILRFFENKIVRSYLFGLKVERPFPPEQASPFASLLGTKSEKEEMDDWDKAQQQSNKKVTKKSD